MYTGCFLYDFTCLKCYKMTSFCPIFTIRSGIIPEFMWLQNNLILSKVCGSFHLYVAKSKMRVIRHFGIFGPFCYHMLSHAVTFCFNVNELLVIKTPMNPFFEDGSLVIHKRCIYPKVDGKCVFHYS